MSSDALASVAMPTAACRASWAVTAHLSSLILITLSGSPRRGRSGSARLVVYQYELCPLSVNAIQNLSVFTLGLL